MLKIIGVLLVILALGILFGASVSAMGFKQALTLWGGAIVLVLAMLTGVLLICI